MNLPQLNRRACGECRACCTTCAVNELDKPLNTPCVHLSPIGCGIYDARPQSCRTYDCAWLQGYLLDDDRPDKSGIVWTFEKLDSFDGLLVHAMLMHDQIPLSRIESRYKQLRQTSQDKLILQIIPHDLHAGPRAKITGRPVGPGVYVAVEEAKRGSRDE